MIIVIVVNILVNMGVVFIQGLLGLRQAIRYALFKIKIRRAMRQMTRKFTLVNLNKIVPVFEIPSEKNGLETNRPEVPA